MQPIRPDRAPQMGRVETQSSILGWLLGRKKQEKHVVRKCPTCGEMVNTYTGIFGQINYVLHDKPDGTSCPKGKE